MATQRTPDSTVMEAGRRALLARSTSGRGDEEIVLTKARGSLVWDVDGREDIDCKAGPSELVIPLEEREVRSLGLTLQQRDVRLRHPRWWEIVDLREVSR